MQTKKLSSWRKFWSFTTLHIPSHSKAFENFKRLLGLFIAKTNIRYKYTML